MDESGTSYRGHIIFAAATQAGDSSWVASFSAWATPLLSPAGASIRGGLAGPYFSLDAAILAIVNEGMHRIDKLLDLDVPNTFLVDSSPVTTVSQQV